MLTISEPGFNEMLRRDALNLNSVFIHDCSKCGACCKFPVPLFITGPDLFYMAKHFKMLPQRFADQYLLAGTDKILQTPLYKVRQHIDGKCEFLHENNVSTRCAIYEARPFRCALHPLEEFVDTDTNLSRYVLRDQGCRKKLSKKPPTTWTLKEYMEKHNLAALAEENRLWTETYYAVAEIIAKHKECGKDGYIMSTLDDFLYLDYNIEQPYIPQLKTHREDLDEYLGHMYNGYIPH